MLTSRNDPIIVGGHHDVKIIAHWIHICKFLLHLNILLGDKAFQNILTSFVARPKSLINKKENTIAEMVVEFTNQMT